MRKKVKSRLEKSQDEKADEIMVVRLTSQKRDNLTVGTTMVA